MSACERCWADAHVIANETGDPNVYRKLLLERECTPEQQAGLAAGTCPVCGCKTLHQHTGKCMNGICRERKPI